MRTLSAGVLCHVCTSEPAATNACTRTKSPPTCRTRSASTALPVTTLTGSPTGSLCAAPPTDEGWDVDDADAEDAPAVAGAAGAAGAAVAWEDEPATTAVEPAADESPDGGRSGSSPPQAVSSSAIAASAVRSARAGRKGRVSAEGRNRCTSGFIGFLRCCGCR